MIKAVYISFILQLASAANRFPSGTCDCVRFGCETSLAGEAPCSDQDQWGGGGSENPAELGSDWWSGVCAGGLRNDASAVLDAWEQWKEAVTHRTSLSSCQGGVKALLFNLNLGKS